MIWDPERGFTSSRDGAIVAGVELVGVAEIAQMFGVSRQRVSKISQEDDFPEPIAILKAGRIWRRLQ